MLPEPVNILLVDDQPENLLALEAILGNLGENLVQATSGEEALRCLLYDDFAVILLDVQMPEMDGFEVATLIRRRQRSRETPIIFLTAFSTTEQFMFQGYALGAVDYLIKPIAPNILRSKVQVFVELFKKTEALRQKTEALEQKATQLAATNTKLQLSEERFRSLSTCSPVGVFVTDVAGRCIYTNPRLQAVCGFAALSETNQDWLQAIHLDDRERAIATWSLYLQTAQEYSQEFRLQTHDGSLHWVQIRSARMHSEQGRFLGHVGTIEDITERKQAESANAQIIREQAARQEAEVANRMKDEFIAILSHELRTPLNSMLGWSRLLRSRQCDEQTVTRALEIIERNATSQARLIEDILDVSQIIRGKLRLNCAPVDLVAITQAAMEIVQPLANAKAIALSADWNGYSLLQVMGDAVRLQQVVWNLLTNAVKFTPKQGQVEIKVSVVESAPLAVANTPSTPSASAQPYAQIQVTDTGIGISPDFLPHVFDRFRQGDSTSTRAYGGLGLGLAIVCYLVEQHQGWVQADSPGVDQGATFTIKLPLLQAERHDIPTADILCGAIAPQPLLLDDCQVLIIDDDADTRDFLAFLLQSVGATVMTTASSVEALQVLESQEPAILLCDISMPEIDGYTLIGKIRTQLPAPQSQIPAIALTAHARVSDQEQALAAGFQKHLAKPIEPETLVQAILELLTPDGYEHSKLIAIDRTADQALR